MTSPGRGGPAASDTHEGSAPHAQRGAASSSAASFPIFPLGVTDASETTRNYTHFEAHAELAEARCIVCVDDLSLSTYPLAALLGFSK